MLERLAGAAKEAAGAAATLRSETREDILFGINSTVQADKFGEAIFRLLAQ
jgi:hypothetical protein